MPRSGFLDLFLALQQLDEQEKQRQLQEKQLGLAELGAFTGLLGQTLNPGALPQGALAQEFSGISPSLIGALVGQEGIQPGLATQQAAAVRGGRQRATPQQAETLETSAAFTGLANLAPGAAGLSTEALNRLLSASPEYRGQAADIQNVGAPTVVQEDQQVFAEKQFNQQFNAWKAQNELGWAGLRQQDRALAQQFGMHMASLKNALDEAVIRESGQGRTQTADLMKQITDNIEELTKTDMQNPARRTRIRALNVAMTLINQNLPPELQFPLVPESSIDSPEEWERLGLIRGLMGTPGEGAPPGQRTGQRQRGPSVYLPMH